MEITQEDYSNFKTNLNKHFNGNVKEHGKSITPLMSNLSYYVESAMPSSKGGYILHNRINTFYFKNTWGNYNYEGGKYEIEITRFLDHFHTINDNKCVSRHLDISECHDVSETEIKADITKVIDTSIDFILGLFDGPVYRARKPNIFRNKKRYLEVCTKEKKHQISHSNVISIYTPTIVNEKYKLMNGKVSKAPQLSNKEISREELTNILKDHLNILYDVYLTTNNPISQTLDDYMKVI